jgi:TatD DNase family protein
MAKEFIKRGIYLSFGPNLLESISNPYKYFSELDKEFIFVETDDSTISIEDIYKQAAELRSIEIDEMANIIESNFKKCFKNVSLAK